MSSAKGKFTILFVDDRPNLLEKEIEKLRDYLLSLGLELETHFDETGENVEDVLASVHIDIVATDWNISEIITGVEVVWMVSQSGVLTDILFYSGQSFDEEEMKEIVDYDYRFIEFEESEDIVPKLKGLIDKNIARSKDIIYIRGVILSAVIDLDILINEIITKYFKIDALKQVEFYDFILENTNFSFEGKIKTIFKIIKSINKSKEYKKLRENLCDLQMNRNYVAHCKRHATDRNCLVSMGSNKLFDRNSMKGLLNKTKETIRLLKTLSSELPQ